jgi:hypothetical protein
MAERRSLTQGVKAAKEVDPALVEEFVFNRKPKPGTQPLTEDPQPADAPGEGKGRTASPLGRAPLTIRFRSHFATALKRASLERQLKGVTPNTLQDILEEAVEPWLRANGYLS